MAPGQVLDARLFLLRAFTLTQETCHGSPFSLAGSFVSPAPKSLQFQRLSLKLDAMTVSFRAVTETPSLQSSCNELDIDHASLLLSFLKKNFKAYNAINRSHSTLPTILITVLPHVTQST